MSDQDLYRLDDEQYRDYVRAELIRARQSNGPKKRGFVDVLLTVVFFFGIVLIVLHQNGLIGGK